MKTWEEIYHIQIIRLFGGETYIAISYLEGELKIFIPNEALKEIGGMQYHSILGSSARYLKVNGLMECDRLTKRQKAKVRKAIREVSA